MSFLEKEKYFTLENRKKKIREWEFILKSYFSNKRKFSFNVNNSALLIIDMQKYFLDSSSPAFIPSAETIIKPIENLAKMFKKRNRPVIFTKYGLNQKKNQNNLKKE